MSKVNTRMRLLLVMLVAAFAVGCLLTACGGKSDTGNGVAAKDTLGDTIKVATLWGPASFFSYRDTLMGYDYDYMEAIAAKHKKSVYWIVTLSLDEAVRLAETGEVDMICAPVPEEEAATKYKGKITLCGPEMEVDEVLVQPEGDSVLVNVKQLAGQTVIVAKGSKAEKKLKDINKSLGGKIDIKSIDPDDKAIEDILAETAKKKEGIVATDRETAMINKTYYPSLQITMSLSEPEKTRWAVSDSRLEVGALMDKWCKGNEPKKIRKDILYKYLEAQKNMPVADAGYDRDFENGYASPFDHLFKAHAEGTRWDWRLLAAQGYTESKFDSTAKSFAGAEGVMQIMPGTAKDYGLKKSEMKSADKSIETAVKILNSYDKIMADKVSDPEERIKFTLASYNAGPGHVLDAINLAKKYGLDPTVWDDNVEKAMLMKMNKKYYNDPVVKHGYSRGRETVDYVDRIYNYYDQAVNKIHKGDAFESHSTDA